MIIRRARAKRFSVEYLNLDEAFSTSKYFLDDKLWLLYENEMDHIKIFSKNNIAFQKTVSRVFVSGRFLFGNSWVAKVTKSVKKRFLAELRFFYIGSSYFSQSNTHQLKRLRNCAVLQIWLHQNSLACNIYQFSSHSVQW